MATERCATSRQFQAADAAFKKGDLPALKAALDDPEGFPNCRMPMALALGEWPLQYAIAWSPLDFIARLIECGADPNFAASDGFPSLIAALDRALPDRLALLDLLLDRGADPGQRGINGWTALHAAVAHRDLPAIRLLLDGGADPGARTDVDDDTTPLEDAEAMDFREAVALLREATRRNDQI